jgi:hypothetical protein
VACRRAEGRSAKRRLISSFRASQEQEIGAFSPHISFPFANDIRRPDIHPSTHSVHPSAFLWYV